MQENATLVGDRDCRCSGGLELPHLLEVGGPIALVLEDQGDRPTDLEEVRQLQAA